MNDILRRKAVFALLFVVAITTGCTELRGRRRIREGTRLYREGNYPGALLQFQAAAPLVPALPQVWLGQGLSCRQMIIAGAATPDNARAVDCALAALEQLRRLRPNDPRGESLYVQTLFDADRYPALVALYAERLRRNPSDLAALNGEIQAYSRWNHVEEALADYQKRAVLTPNDPEAQYAVGVYVWQQLFQRGGGPDKAAFDPRHAASADGPTAVAGKRKKGRRGRQGKQRTTDGADANVAGAPSTNAAPLFAVGDITGSQRVAMADLGIQYLKRALVLRPQYREAMVYLNLLLRQKSLAYFQRPAAWQACIDEAESWRAKVDASTPAPTPPPGQTTANTKGVTASP